MSDITKFEDLKGHTITAIEGKAGDDEMVFTLADGRRFRLSHDQDCCERVYLEDVAGYLDDLIGVPLAQAEEVSNMDEPPTPDDADDSYTWTFYKLGTINGYVTLRWFGSSNGYYSESVDFGAVP